MTLIEETREFILHLLDDEHGITEDAYNGLKIVADSINILCAANGLGNVSVDPFKDIWNAVDATDGRFYLKEGAAELLQT